MRVVLPFSFFFPLFEFSNNEDLYWAESYICPEIKGNFRFALRHRGNMIIEQTGSACSATAVKKILITRNFADLFEASTCETYFSTLRAAIVFITGKNDVKRATRVKIPA